MKARIFGIIPKTLYRWYRNQLSDYKTDNESGNLPVREMIVDNETGETVSDKPLYILKPENVGEKMSIDDKAIGHDGYTIMSNTETGKIAMFVESTRCVELEPAVAQFGNTLQQVKSISCDMSPTCLKICHEQMPKAQTVVDKFHVMQYVYDALPGVRSRIQKELSSRLFEGKIRTDADKIILDEIAMLRRIRHRLTQSSEIWNQNGVQVMKQVFEKHPLLEQAYQLTQDFKCWYGASNCGKNKDVLRQQLQR